MNKKLYLYISLILLIILPVLIPYVHQGYFPTHDGEWAVVRLVAMYRQVSDFQIPARYSSFLGAGHGYPLFNFAYPMPYYLGLILLALGFGYISSIKLLFALSVIASAIGMFLLSKKLWSNELAGLVSAILYVYMPYRFVDLFVRGSLGESIGFALFPLILLCVLYVSANPKNIWWTLAASLLLGILIPTHNIMAVLFLPVLLLFMIMLYVAGDKKIYKPYIFILVIGILLSSFFWLPAIIEKNSIWLAKIPIADRTLYFVTIRDLLFSKWGYAPPTEPGGFSYQIGWPQLSVLVLSIGMLLGVILKQTKKRNVDIYAILLSILTVIMILLMFKQFAIVWKLPLMSEINYPWTWLSQITLVIPLLSGYLLTFKKKWLTIIAVLLAISAVILYVSYAKPSEYVDRADEFYTTNDATTTSSDEYYPLWTEEKPLSRPENLVQESDIVTAIFSTYSSGTFTTEVSLQDDTTVTINRLYYPGWMVFVDNQEVPITYQNPFGSIQIEVPEGNHTIKGKFTETPLRVLANMLTIISFGLLLLIILVKPIRKRTISLLTS